ncbi:MAG: TIGR04372 family glycosyltransferase [Paracoccaceae bacterium]|nr:TIGR04372 family glycosyltransferase [Paracoccaceae bacterium]
MNKIFTKPEITGLAYYNDCDFFRQIFELLCSKGDFKKVIEYLEGFFTVYPLQRHDLISVYFHCMTSIGNAKIAYEAIRIFVETTEQLARIGEEQFSAPLVVEQNGFLTRIGEAVDQTALTHLYQELGLLKKKPIIFSANKLQLANEAFLPYVEDYFDIIVDASLSNYFERIRPISPYQPAFYKFSDSQYGHNGNFFWNCQKQISSKGISLQPFKLKDITIEKAMEFLKTYDISYEDEFVVLHLREVGYFDAAHHGWRNAPPSDFIDTVDYFLSQGLKVVRIGHSKMTPMPERSGFIDLTQTEKPDEVDLFLCGKAKFYFGSGSGPASIALHFGVPCCEIRRVAATGARQHHFVQNIPFKEKKSGYTLRFEDFWNHNVEHIHAPLVFNNLGWVPSFPTPEKNLQFAKESLEYVTRGKIFQVNQSCQGQREKYQIWGGMCSESLPLIY